MSESSCRKLVAENPAEDEGERIGGFRASRCTSRVRLGRVTGRMARFGGTAGWGSRPMMSGEFITSFKMVSAEFDTTAMRAFRYNGRISEYIYGTASLALCGRAFKSVIFEYVGLELTTEAVTLNTYVPMSSNDGSVTCFLA